jgi:hypothetical protein
MKVVILLENESYVGAIDIEGHINPKEEERADE